MRMFLTGFTDSVILRFAEIELVRNQWRRYNRAVAAFLFGDEGVRRAAEPVEDVPD